MEFDPQVLTSEDVEKALDDVGLPTFGESNPWAKLKGSQKMKELGFESLVHAIVSMNVFNRHTEIDGPEKGMKDMLSYGIDEKDAKCVVMEINRMAKMQKKEGWQANMKECRNGWRAILENTKKEWGNSELEKALWGCLQNNHLVSVQFFSFFCLSLPPSFLYI